MEKNGKIEQTEDYHIYRRSANKKAGGTKL
jgi:hypothetical protein